MLNSFHDFMGKTLFITVLCSIMGQQNSCIVSQRGGGEEGKWGSGGENPEREGG